MTQGLVSIIIAAYRHEKYIGALLESIAEQTYDKIEVLVCDDCSPDDTYRVALEYEGELKSRFERVVICKNETNSGVCKTFNRLLSMCEGEFVKPIASDDFFATPQAVQRYMETFEANPDAGAVDANVYPVEDEASYPLKKFHTRAPFYASEPNFEPTGLTSRLYEENYICAPSLMYRRSILEPVGPYDEGIVFEDWDFNLRMAEQGVKIVYCNECLVAYRQVGGSQSHNMSEAGSLRHCKGQIQTLNKHMSYVNPEHARRVQKNVLYRYYGIAVDNGYAELKQYVKTVLKEKKLSLREWYISRTKGKLAVMLKNILPPEGKKDVG